MPSLITIFLWRVGDTLDANNHHLALMSRDDSLFLILAAKGAIVIFGRCRDSVGPATLSSVWETCYYVGLCTMR